MPDFKPLQEALHAVWDVFLGYAGGLDGSPIFGLAAHRLATRI